MKRLVLITLLSIALPAALAAQSNLRSEQEKLEKEIAILDKQLQDNARKSSSALSSLNLARKKVASSRKLYEQSSRKVAQIDAQIRSMEKEIESLGRQLDTMSAHYARLVRVAYLNRDSRLWFMYVLSSESVGQGLHRAAYMKNLALSMNAQSARIREQRALLENQKEELVAKRSEAERLRSEQQKRLKSLKADEAKSQKIVNTLKKNRGKYQKELAARRKQVEALNREIKSMIERKSSKSSKEVDVKLSSQFSANKG